MGIVTLQRPHYRPKGPVIQYIVEQRALVRSRPSRVRNPRTAAQQLNRKKLGVASRFLAAFPSFVSKGFARGEGQNGRAIGAYHLALGRLLANAMVREHGGWRIDYEKVELAEGEIPGAYPLTIHRAGRTLRLEWKEGLPVGTKGVRLAVYNAKKHAITHVQVAIQKIGAIVEVILPKWADSNSLHVWWQPITDGKTRWASAYVGIPTGVVSVTGCIVAVGHKSSHSISLNESTIGDAHSTLSGSGSQSRAPNEGVLLEENSARSICP